MGSSTRDEVMALGAQVRSLIRLSDRFRSGIAVELGIGVTDLTALGYLVEEGQLSPTQIAGRMCLAPATISAVVDHLVASGFASRTRDPTDRRRLWVRPTPAGTHARAWAEERLDQLIGDALDDAPHPPPGSIASFLERVNLAMATHMDSPNRAR